MKKKCLEGLPDALHRKSNLVRQEHRRKSHMLDFIFNHKQDENLVDNSYII